MKTKREKRMEAFNRISRKAGEAALFLDGAEPAGAIEKQLNEDRETVRQALADEDVGGGDDDVCMCGLKESEHTVDVGHTFVSMKENYNTPPQRRDALEAIIELIEEARNEFEAVDMEPCLCGNPHTEPSCPHCNKAINANRILDQAVAAVRALSEPAVPEDYQRICDERDHYRNECHRLHHESFVPEAANTERVVRYFIHYLPDHLKPERGSSLQPYMDALERALAQHGEGRVPDKDEHPIDRDKWGR